MHILILRWFTVSKNGHQRFVIPSTFLSCRLSATHTPNRHRDTSAARHPLLGRVNEVSFPRRTPTTPSLLWVRCTCATNHTLERILMADQETPPSIADAVTAAPKTITTITSETTAPTAPLPKPKGYNQETGEFIL